MMDAVKTHSLGQCSHTLAQRVVGVGDGLDAAVDGQLLGHLQAVLVVGVGPGARAAGESPPSAIGSA